MVTLLQASASERIGYTTQSSGFQTGVPRGNLSVQKAVWVPSYTELDVNLLGVAAKCFITKERFDPRIKKEG